MNNLFLLIFLVFASICICNCAVTEGYCHRVKRSAMVNATKAMGNSTTLHADKEIGKIVNATETKSKRIVDEDIATKIRSAIEKLRLGSPTTIYVRHMKLNKTDPATLHKSRRTIEKEHCTELKHPKSFFLFSPHATEEFEDDEHKNEKLVEFLTGKATESKHHHDRYGRSFYVKDNAAKKSKRNVPKPSIHHIKLHKDTKDHKFKRSEGSESPIENFLRLTKMLVEMSENMRPVEPPIHTHKTDTEIIAPNSGNTERLSELIYKPMANVDATIGDDVALVSSNEYLSNEFNGIPQPQHSILPLESVGYHEITFPLISNFSPLKLLSSAVESELSSSLSTDKDDNDSDEYEMTCPVHFKRSTDNVSSKDSTPGGGGGGGGGGVMELCTCHLYRKKKQVL